MLAQTKKEESHFFAISTLTGVDGSGTRRMEAELGEDEVLMGCDVIRSIICDYFASIYGSINIRIKICTTMS